jgi:AraC-like DNA-binding protein
MLKMTENEINSVSSPLNPLGPVTVAFTGEPRGETYDAWRDELWNRFGRVVPDAIGTDHLNCRADYNAVANVRLVTAESGPAHFERSRQLIADQCDDFMLFSVVAGAAEMTQLGKPVELRPTEMLLGHLSEEGAVRVASTATFTTIRVSRRDLLSLCPKAENRMAIRLDHSPALRQTIASYFALIGKVGSSLDVVGQQRLSQHTLEMVALLLEGGSALKGPADGLSSSAKVDLIRRYILQHLTDPVLSIGAVAAHFACHPKQVQRLFAASGCTFSDFVLEERLLLARRKLMRADSMEKISNIAFDVGFNDLSYFNRAFRVRFGMTPSWCRTDARK